MDVLSLSARLRTGTEKKQRESPNRQSSRKAHDDSTNTQCFRAVTCCQSPITGTGIVETNFQGHPCLYSQHLIGGHRL